MDIVRGNCCILDGHRAVLENIYLASAMRHTPEGVFILPIGSLSWPKPMESCLCIVKSICEQHLPTRGPAQKLYSARRYAAIMCAVRASKFACVGLPD